MSEIKPSILKSYNKEKKLYEKSTKYLYSKFTNKKEEKEEEVKEGFNIEKLINNIKLIKNYNSSKKNIKFRSNINYLMETTVFELLKFVGLKNFMEFNRIDIYALMKSLNSIDILEMSQKDIVFCQGESSDGFYIIVDGQVEIIVHDYRKKNECKVNKEIIGEKKENIKFHIKKLVSSCKFTKSEIYDQIYNIEDYDERQILIFNSGECFGEWGLINHESRSTSARIFSEKAVLMKIGEKCFNDFFLTFVVKSELERRELISNRILYLKKIEKSVFKKIIIDIVSIHKKKLEYIYKENEYAFDFYFLVKGNVILQKEFKYKGKTYKYDLMEFKDGTIFGWEVFNFNDQNENEYKVSREYSVYVSSKSSHILKFNYNEYGMNVKEGIRNSLLKEVTNNDQLLKNIYYKNISRQKIYSFDYYNDKNNFKEKDILVKKEKDLVESINLSYNQLKIMNQNRKIGKNNSFENFNLLTNNKYPINSRSIDLIKKKSFFNLYSKNSVISKVNKHKENNISNSHSNSKAISMTDNNKVHKYSHSQNESMIKAISNKKSNRNLFNRQNKFINECLKPILYKKVPSLSNAFLKNLVEINKKDCIINENISSGEFNIPFITLFKSK